MKHIETIREKSEGSRLSWVKLLGFSLLVILWGCIAGFVTGLLFQFLPMIFLYPVVLGINGGRMIVDVIQRTHLRKPSGMIALSLLSALVMYGSYHFCGYLGFQVRVTAQLYEKLAPVTSEMSSEVTTAVLDYALKEETGHTGFVGYLLYRANEGISIGRFYSDNHANLGPVLTWLYWVLEFAIILGLTLFPARKALTRSSCPACGNWYGAETHLGGTTMSNEPILLDLIRQKDFSRLGTLMQKNAELPSLEVYFQGCRVCGNSQSQLVVRRAFQSPKGFLQFKDTAHAVLLPAERAQLVSQLDFSGD